MVTVEDTGTDIFGEAKELREIAGAENVTVYRKAKAKRFITEGEMSEELKANGDFLMTPVNM